MLDGNIMPSTAIVSSLLTAIDACRQATNSPKLIEVKFRIN